MDIADISIIYHIGLVLGALWICTSLGWNSNYLFFLSFFYLYKVTERYSTRLRKRLQHEERRNANQRRVLSDTESVRWLNHAVEKMWPICMENISSQLLSQIIPWFLEKYKPVFVSKANIQKLYMGRNPPLFTEMRVLRESSDGDHLVMELGMNFLAADDMSAVLQTQLSKSLGFGIVTNMHITGMHIEGKVLVGVKFVRKFPFIGRVRICFVEPPYFQMNVKPLISHGMDVTELPIISQWLDGLLDVALGQTLVEPNMLVVNVEKFVSAPTEEWFTVDEKPAVAVVLLEIIEGADMKASDLNGLSDPYIKGQLGRFKFKTNVQRKTLNPKWMEEFKIPISSWEAINELSLEIRDKDPMFDDFLGACSVFVNELRGGERHEKWIPLKNIKKGRIHVALTIIENEASKGIRDLPISEETSQNETKPPLSDPKSTNSTPPNEKELKEIQENQESNQKLKDEFEPININIEGEDKTGVWVHRPGSETSPTFEARKGRVRKADSLIVRENDQNAPDSQRVESSVQRDKEEKEKGSNVTKGLRSMFSRKGSKKKNEMEIEEKSELVNDGLNLGASSTVEVPSTKLDDATS